MVEGVVEMPTPKVSEQVDAEVTVWPMAGGAFVLVVGGAALFSVGAVKGAGVVIALGAVAVVIGAILGSGLTPVQPGRARVLQILGRYAGTLRTDGLRWVNPIATRRE